MSTAKMCATHTKISCQELPELAFSGRVLCVPNELNAEFGRLLEISTWSRYRAAKELGLSPPTVYRYMTGEITPSVPVLRLFASRLREPLRIGPSEGNAALNEPGPMVLADWERELLDLCRRLTPAAREAVMASIRAVLSAAEKQIAAMDAISRRGPDDVGRIAAHTVAGLIATGTYPGKVKRQAAALLERISGDHPGSVDASSHPVPAPTKAPRRAAS